MKGLWNRFSGPSGIIWPVNLRTENTPPLTISSEKCGHNLWPYQQNMVVFTSLLFARDCSLFFLTRGSSTLAQIPGLSESALILFLAIGYRVSPYTSKYLLRRCLEVFLEGPHEVALDILCHGWQVIGVKLTVCHSLVTPTACER